MTTYVLFVTPFSLLGTGTFVQLSALQVQRIHKCQKVQRHRPRKATFVHDVTKAMADINDSSDNAPTEAFGKRETLSEGDIVAIWRGSGRPVDVARITGGVSSGQTVDVIPLKPFVSELYVDANSGSSYESASNVRRVQSEFVPSQDGWIVLDQDLEVAKDYFTTQAADLGQAKVTVIPKDDSRELPPEALERQFFRPTRTQAFLAAALSVPLAATLYASFDRARNVYNAASTTGTDLADSQSFRSLVLLITAGGAVTSLVVGSALFLYALNTPSTDVDN